MRAIVTHPATPTNECLLAPHMRIVIKWDGAIYYMGPFASQQERSSAKWLLTTTPCGNA